MCETCGCYSRLGMDFWCFARARSSSVDGRKGISARPKACLDFVPSLEELDFPASANDITRQ